MPTSVSYQSYLIESLKDSQEAAAYLEAVLENGDVEHLRLALRNVVEARIALIGNSKVVSKWNDVYQILLTQSKADLPTLLKILDELGFKMSITFNDYAA
jgi:DNA-binding phage protein